MPNLFNPTIKVIDNFQRLIAPQIVKSQAFRSDSQRIVYICVDIVHIGIDLVYFLCIDGVSMDHLLLV